MRKNHERDLVESYSIKVNCILAKRVETICSTIIHVSSLTPRLSAVSFFSNFWSERLRRCLIPSKKRAIRKKIYIFIDLSIPVGAVSDVGRTGTTYFYNALRVIASLRAFITYSACYWNRGEKLPDLSFQRVSAPQSSKIPLRSNVAPSRSLPSFALAA